MTDEQQKWKQEVAEFLQIEMTPDFLEELEKQDYSTAAASVSFSKKLAAKGWLTLAWPRQYGGQERSFLEQAIFNYQMGYYLAPTMAHQTGTNQVGRALMVHGTDEQKKRFLPRIARQEIVFAQAHTEPGAGTDLASLKTRAARRGAAYIIDGEKCYCSHAHIADYIYMAVRTDPNSVRHKGISLLVVDAKTPGMSISEMKTINHGRVSSIFFDNVSVPQENLLGEENKGWYMLMSTLAIERSIVRSPGTFQRLFDELIAYAKETRRDGHPIIEEQIMRFRFAEFATDIEVANMLYWRVACLANKGEIPGIEGNFQSLFLSKLEHRFANFGMEVLDHYGQLRRGSK